LRRIHGLLSVCSQRSGYTVRQYALLSSTYAWLGKILKGFSGAEVESLSTTHGLIHAYGIFFIGCGLTGVPAVLLFAAHGLLAQAQTTGRSHGFKRQLTAPFLIESNVVPLTFP
jgi:hypothetical protein